MKGNNVLRFKGMAKKAPLSNRRKSIDVNRDILAKLFGISRKEEKQIDFE